MERLGLRARSSLDRYPFVRRRRNGHGRAYRIEYEWHACKAVWRERHPHNPIYFYTPSDRALWALRDISLSALTSHLNLNRFSARTLKDHCTRRGWLWERSYGATYLSHAPCIACGVTTLIIDLNVHRECFPCRGDDP